MAQRIVLASQGSLRRAWGAVVSSACVRVQAGPPRAGARERVRASPRPADAGAAHRAVAPRARRLERGPALAAGVTRHHRGLPAYLELGLRSRLARAARLGPARAVGGQGHALSLALRAPATVPGRHPSEPARAHRLHRAARRRGPPPPADVAHPPPPARRPRPPPTRTRSPPPPTPP